MHKGIVEFAFHGMVHTTSMLESDCFTIKWRIARISPSSAKRCWAIHTILETMYDAKVETGKHDTPTPTYKGLMKEFRSPNNVEYEFWYCLDDFKHCVSGSWTKYVLDWPMVTNTWPVKISTNLSREEVLALEDAGFHLQQREALSPRCRLSTITILPIPRSHFCMPLTQTPPYIQIWEDSASQSNNTGGGSQKQVGER
jgi:hypothetical protein